jgi:hypothetical protein
MTDEDKTLLELAAKAYGAKPHIVHIGEWYDTSTPERLFWNPLRVDGDALRLAVKLHLSVEIFAESSRHLQGVTIVDHDGRSLDIPHGSDPYAATRLAIVRAAAEIGKALQ